MGLSLSGLGTYAATTYAINAAKIGYSDNSNLGVDNVQAAIDGTCTKFNNQLTNLTTNVISKMYPVGSIYISTSISDAKSVASILGVGTWVTFGDGRVLRSSSGTSEQTGGSSDVTLTTSNLPSHTHSYTPSGSVTSTFTGQSSTTSESGNHFHYIDNGWAINNITFSTASMTNGTSTANNPYVSSNSTNYAGSHTHTVTAKGTVSSAFVGITATTTATGSGTKFSTIDPYITVYMYKRTA